MAWSAKIIAGTVEHEMIYDAASQTDFMLKYDYDIGGDAPSVLYHTPDSGSPIPVRANDQNRLIFLSLIIPKTGSRTWDEVMGIITPISRLVNGADSQAVRAQTHGDVDVVKVGIKPDGATYTTYWDVLDGFIDTSTAFTNQFVADTPGAWEITIALTCSPLGYGDSFTLKNELASSPHMLEDSGGTSGLSDGKTTIGSPTFALATGTYLLGGKSQRVITDNTSDHGFYTNSTTASASTDAVAKIILTAGSTNDVVTIRLTDGSNNVIDSESFDPSAPAGYEKTHVDPRGVTWYEYHVAGANSTAADFRVWVFRRSADASIISTYFVDLIYLQFDTLTAPAAFSSTAAWKNMHTPENAITEINYLDAWGIPGDAPALVDIDFDSGASGNALMLRAARWSDGDVLAADIPYWHESDELDDPLSDFSAGTGTTDNHYLQLPSGDATGKVFKTIEWTAFRRREAAVFLIGRASATSVTFQATLDTSAFNLGGGVNLWTGDTQTVQTANTWEVIPLGVIPATDLVTSGSSLVLHLEVANATSQTGDIDAVVLMPLDNDDNYLLFKTTAYSGAAAAVYDSRIDAGERQVYGGISVQYKQSHQGGLWTMQPGIMNRSVLLFTSNSNQYSIITTGTITLTITPRTRHLLGTI